MLLPLTVSETVSETYQDCCSGICQNISQNHLPYTERIGPSVLVLLFKRTNEGSVTKALLPSSNVLSVIFSTPACSACRI